jgi:hypothetical protein
MASIQTSPLTSRLWIFPLKLGGTDNLCFQKGNGLTTVIVWVEFNATTNQNVRTYDPVGVKTHYAVIYA